MNMRRFAAPLILAGFVLSLAAAPAAAQQQKPEPKPQPKMYIPPAVKDVLAANLATRQVRQDIPFTVFKQLYLPGRDSTYIYFFYKMKNADLGFAPAPASIAAIAPDAGPKVRAVVDLFLQFHQVENGNPAKVIREVYVPVAIEKDAAAYEQEKDKEEWYTIGYPLMPGTYLLATALTSHDLKRIGIAYCDFTLPEAKSFTKELDTTPIFFLKDYKEVAAPETITALHAGFLRYAILQIVPNLDNAIGVGDSLDTFFFIYGAKPDAAGAFNIECQYEVMKGKEPAIKFAPQTYQNPFVSQPLPMKQTLLTKSTDEKGVVKESQKIQDLPVGSYTFSIKITDKGSGLTCTKSIDFTIVDKPAK